MVNIDNKTIIPLTDKITKKEKNLNSGPNVLAWNPSGTGLFQNRQ